MLEIQNVDRGYLKVQKDFRIDIPECFNFSFDVTDLRAARNDKTGKTRRMELREKS
jgi:hypothetical protein